MDTCLDMQATLDAGRNTAHSAFGRCRESAQNECPGWNSTERVIVGCTDLMWGEGPPPAGTPCGGGTTCYSQHGHYINMTSAGYHRMSVGFFRTSGTTYWSLQDFWP